MKRRKEGKLFYLTETRFACFDLYRSPDNVADIECVFRESRQVRFVEDERDFLLCLGVGEKMPWSKQ